MATLVAVRLPDDLDKRLGKLSDQTGRSKSYYLKKALEQFLEDREDYLLAVARLEEENPRVSYKDLRKELGNIYKKVQKQK